jgi:hypothetical protein
MILNDMGVNLLVDAPPAKVTANAPKRKSGSEIQGLAARFSHAVNDRNR